jgi:cation diffusion facilitator family transporter
VTTDVQPLKPEVCSVHEPPVQARAEARTRWVVYLTAVMMVAELIAGYASHSLALVADGWHMMTHVGALGLSAVAYWYARTRAHEERFAFGTGKVYALAGFSSSALLLAVAGLMTYSAIERLMAPEDIKFAEAMSVAVIGLIVNFVSAMILSGAQEHGHSHAHDHAHGHGDDHHHHHDHNLRSAYVHVIADALTSVLAIAAIAGSALLHWRWLDPAVAIVGALIILQWCFKLLSETGRQLVDLDPSTVSRDAVRAALEKLPDTRVCDLHLWRVGPGKLVCVVAVLAKSPLPLDDYKKAVSEAVPIAHLTVEVRPA